MSDYEPRIKVRNMTLSEYQKEQVAKQEATKYDTDKPPLSMLPYSALAEVAKVLDFGAQKYDRDNWRKGMDWTRLVDSSLRHTYQFNDGEDIDLESGLPHIAHAICGLLFLLEYQLKNLGKDDRAS